MLLKVNWNLLNSFIRLTNSTIDPFKISQSAVRRAVGKSYDSAIHSFAFRLFSHPFVWVIAKGNAFKPYQAGKRQDTFCHLQLVNNWRQECTIIEPRRVSTTHSCTRALHLIHYLSLPPSNTPVSMSSKNR